MKYCQGHGGNSKHLSGGTGIGIGRNNSNEVKEKVRSRTVKCDFMDLRFWVLKQSLPL